MGPCFVIRELTGMGAARLLPELPQLGQNHDPPATRSLPPLFENEPQGDLAAHPRCSISGHRSRIANGLEVGRVSNHQLKVLCQADARVEDVEQGDLSVRRALN